MARYDHGFLVLVSLISGVILALFGLLGLGRFARLIPNSVVVGFTIGIAVSIAFTNLGDALGLEQAVRGALWDRLRIIFESLGEINGFAIGIFAASLLANRALPKISPFLPTPLLTIVLGTAAATLLGELGQPLPLVRDRFGSIPADLFRWTPPSLPYFSSAVIFVGLYFVTAIVFISGVESLLCSSMADRLAENKRTPFDPDKEFWGQGLVQIITPLANGFPCTGALARTATSIRAGAITPLAGYAKGLFKILLAMASARFLEQIPLAGIAAVLFWVASNMIKADEVKAVRRTGKRSSVVMWVTAVLVPITDFLTGVCGGLVLHAALVAFNKKERK
jgi:MFS superfamily sulfate permease-like transporter